MIVVVEGASAAGKTTWCARHAPTRTIAEGDPDALPTPPESDPLALAKHWQRANERRWELAVAAERDAGVAVCDTDPFKAPYSWTRWQAGLAPFGEWQVASTLAREAFRAGRLGLADVVAYADLDRTELRRRREADPARTRRRFELHVALAEPLRRWYEAVDSLDPGRVIWELPAAGLDDPRLRPAPRAERYGDALFVALLRALDARSRPARVVDEAAWFAQTRALLESAYLASDDPRAQSGKSGDAAAWERGRRVIARAIARDGTFLDLGCANGHLMETLTDWAAADGRRIEPYGLDISEALAALARRRLLRWSDRIFVGNALDWVPPRRFDHVRTELEYVPDHRRAEYVARLLRDVVAPGGRLIVCGYGSASRPDMPAPRVGDLLRQWGHTVAGEAEALATNGATITRVAWVDAP